MASTTSFFRMPLRRALALSAAARVPLRRTAASWLSSSPPTAAPFSTSSAFQSAADAAAPAAPPAEAPAAASAAAARPVSACPEGTVLTGLSYTKGQSDPVALRDEDYPPWLWDCLDVMKKADATEDADAGDEFSKSKKQRRMALRRQRELEAKVLATGDIAALAPKIPLQHQSLNLPTTAAGDAAAEAADPLALDNTLAAAAKRKELRVALRKERRAKIKESNYLRSM